MAKIPGIHEAACIRLFETILGMDAQRQYRFPFLRGDPTPKRPHGVPLPVDAYFPSLRLVVEYMGHQHVEKNPLMDRRPGRRDQRRRYQVRRTAVLTGHGITVIRVQHDEPLTEATVRAKLRDAGYRL